MWINSVMTLKLGMRNTIKIIEQDGLRRNPQAAYGREIRTRNNLHQKKIKYIYNGG